MLCVAFLLVYLCLTVLCAGYVLVYLRIAVLCDADIDVDVDVDVDVENCSKMTSKWLQNGSKMDLLGALLEAFRSMLFETSKMRGF